MKGLILAAGKGTRMRPITLEKPKPLIGICGRPFISYIIDNLRSAGIDEIGIIIGYMKEKIADYIEKEYPDVALIDQTDALGTGHAVLSAKDWIKNENFVVLMGDNLYSPGDIRSVCIDDALCYITGICVRHPENYGTLVTDGDYLVKIMEKAQHPPSSIVNAGLYKFTPDILDILEHAKPSPRGEIELTDAVSDLAKKRKVKVVMIKDYWKELAVPEDIERMESFIKEFNLNTN